MDGESLDITQDKLNRLKELFPEVFTEDGVDWEKLKAALGEDINFSNERYVLNGRASPMPSGHCRRAQQPLWLPTGKSRRHRPYFSYGRS